MKVVFTFILLSVVSCSHLPRVPAIPYSLEFDAPPRIRFQGKGAAAGMMMSSSMGPMGIAIGVAIDEGIAKDIQAAADKAGCALDQVVAGAFEQASARHGRSAIQKNPDSEDVAVIRIHRIGFVVTSGEADPAYVAAELSIRFNGVDYSIRHPIEQDTPPFTTPLERLKADGEPACRMLDDALQGAFDEWYMRL